MQRVLFFGTDCIAAACLRSLAQSGITSNIEVVCPAPRTQKTRKKMVTLECEVFKASQELSITTHLVPTTETFNLKDWKAPASDTKGEPFNLGVVVSFGYRVPAELTQRFTCINLHPSLLPSYRGATPMQTALLNGENQSGVSIITVEQSIDAGRILKQITEPLSADDTYVSVRERLTRIGADAVIDTIQNLDTRLQEAQAQDATLVTHAPKYPKQKGQVAWTQPAASIYNLWRGFHGWTPVFTFFNGTRVVVTLCGAHTTHSGNSQLGMQAGCWVYDKPNRVLLIRCGDKNLVACSHLHFACKKLCTAQEFANGMGKKLTETMFE